MTKRIALCDMNHTTVGIHAECMPLGAGLIGSYLKKLFNSDIDVRIYKFPENLTHDLNEGWVPDVLGAAMYSWNTYLDLHYAHYIKQCFPQTLILVGGPDVPTEPDETKHFLAKNDYVDLIINLDAEIPFARAIEEVLSGKGAGALREQPVTGTRSLPRNSDTVIYAPMPERLKSLDEIPSPYLNGLFDQFLKMGLLAPLIETNRGCPFTCTFCHQALSYFNKPLWKSLEMLEQELELFARTFAGRHDIRLFLTDSNFGSFQRDQQIADIIRKYQDRYDWPRFIEVTTGKTRPDDIVKAVQKLKYGLYTTASLQTMTPHVLERIHRKNLATDDFIRLQRMTQSHGGLSNTEVILSLPGETKESFIETIRSIIGHGIDEIVVYTLMNLRGTPLYDEMNLAHQRGEGIIFKYRVVPRQFGRYHGKTIFDTEQVVVGTPSMPFEDYVWLRGFSLIVNNVYNSKAFPELARFLRENRVDLMAWLLSVYDRIQTNEGVLGKQMSAFLEETRDECFDSGEELQAYYEKEENYRRLLSGERGTNLRMKYVCEALRYSFENWLDISMEAAREFLLKAPGGLSEREADAILRDLKTYFVSTRNVVAYFFHEDIDTFLEQKHVIELEYDIPAWLRQGDGASGGEVLLRSLYHGRRTYELFFSDKLKENIRTVNRKNDAEKSVKVNFILNTFSSHYCPELQPLQESQNGVCMIETHPAQQLFSPMK